MIKLEFGIVHRGCLVNEVSRALPGLRLICPGGFIVADNTVEELLVLDGASRDELQRFLEHLRAKSGVAEAEVLQATSDKTFVRVVVTVCPDSGFCSQAVARNRGFRIGMELQEGGVEKWTVGCFRRSDAERMLEELGRMGEVKYHTVSEVSWEELLVANGRGDGAKGDRAGAGR